MYINLKTFIVHGSIRLVLFGSSHRDLTALHVNSRMKAEDLEYFMGVMAAGSQLRELSVRFHLDLSLRVVFALACISKKFPELRTLSISAYPVNALVSRRRTVCKCP